MDTFKLMIPVIGVSHSCSEHSLTYFNAFYFWFESSEVLCQCGIKEHIGLYKNFLQGTVMVMGQPGNQSSLGKPHLTGVSGMFSRARLLHHNICSLCYNCLLLYMYSSQAPLHPA